MGYPPVSCDLLYPKWNSINKDLNFASLPSTYVSSCICVWSPNIYLFILWTVIPWTLCLNHKNAIYTQSLSHYRNHKSYWAIAWSLGFLAEQGSMQGHQEASHVGQQSDSRGLKTPVCLFSILLHLNRLFCTLFYPHFVVCCAHITITPSYSPCFPVSIHVLPPVHLPRQYCQYIMLALPSVSQILG
jgi:hypothetical protein